MSRKTSIILLIAMFVAALAVPSAVARSSHKYSAKVVAATVASDNGYPGVGGTARLVGSLDSSLGGGAVVDRVMVTGHPESNVFTFVGGEVDYFARGTQHNLFAGTVTIQPDGSQKIVIEGRFTGGTGAYRGASGQFRYAGTAPAGSTIITGASHGTLTY